MLTYQLQRRVLMKKDRNEFVFPNNLEIEILFEPSSQYGNVVEKGKTVRKGSKATMFYDSNTGRTWVNSDRPLEPINASIEWTNLKLKLKANKLTANAKCNSRKDLGDLLVTLHYILPILLNLEFAEPPVAKYTKGKIGRAEFNRELAERLSCFDATSEISKKGVFLIHFSELTNSIAGD